MERNLEILENYIDDEGLIEKYATCKVIGKHNLATYIHNELGYFC